MGRAIIYRSLRESYFMDIDARIKYWTGSAAHDIKAARHLFDTRDYPHALFFGHLYLEKLLKALIVRRSQRDAPYGHKLYTLALKADLELTERQHDLLTRATAYNLATRYPDQRLSMYKRFNRKFTQAELDEIQKMGRWIESHLK